MTTLFKFHELSKSQMNEVKGGYYYSCTAKVNGKEVPMPAVDALSASEAVALIKKQTGLKDVECTEM